MLVFISYAVALGDVGMVCFFVCYYSARIFFNYVQAGIAQHKISFFFLQINIKGKKKGSLIFFFFFFNNTISNRHTFFVKLKD